MSTSTPTPAADRPEVDVRGVTLSFGRSPVLDNLTLAVTEAQTLVVLGESGSGKSTLLSLILGLLHPEKGEVYVRGVKISGQHERVIYPVRKQIGMVFQHGALFDSETVKVNIGFRLLREPNPDMAAVEREVAEKLAFVGLDGYGERYPSELSGGQKKRVAIARAMVGNPAIMLYDEPTTGLDPITARKVLEVIERIKQELGTTSIVVTHELHYAYSIADRVVLIRNGRIYFDGTATEFRTSTDPYVVEFRSMEVP